jgi:hypothetical protein
MEASRGSKEVETRNPFAPLRSCNMDTDAPGTESTPAEETAQKQSGRPSSIILTSVKNLIQFRNSSNATGVLTKDMVDYQAVKAHFENTKLSYYTFYPKSQKPVKVSE